MKDKWHEKLQSSLEYIKNISDEDLNNDRVVSSLVKEAFIKHIELQRDQLTAKTGEKFISFTDSDIPPGLIIPLSGKTFEYALYEIPFKGNSEAAQQLLKDLDTPAYQYISNNKFVVVLYYGDKIDDNPAVKARIELIARNSINKFEEACNNFNREADGINAQIENTLRTKVESEKPKRRDRFF